MGKVRKGWNPEVKQRKGKYRIDAFSGTIIIQISAGMIINAYSTELRGEAAETNAVISLLFKSVVIRF